MQNYIGAALESSLAQTHAPCEILCIDDGSEDGTVQVIQEFVDLNPSIVSLLQLEHSGAPTARNCGLEVARGEYIQFLDADDTLRPRKLERQLALAKSQDPNADLICAAFQSCSENDEQKTTVRSSFNDCWAGLLHGRGAAGVTSSNLFNRKRVIDCGGWDTSRKSSQEPELMFRMMRDGTHALYDPELLTLKLRRKQGAIWTSDNSPANKISQMTSFLDLRFDILDYLASQKKLNHRHLKAVSIGVAPILAELEKLDSLPAKQRQEQLDERLQVYAAKGIFPDQN